MLIEHRSTKDALSRIVRELVADPTLQEDLLQEALLHLWLMEDRRPGQTRSWYLQSCRFHLQHCLASGRSVDSRKRHDLEVDSAFEDDEALRMPVQFDADTSFLAQICARELIALLARQLKPRAQAILACLVDGLGPREIARRLRISHPTVSKYRCEIAGLVLKLGIPRPTHNRTSRRNGVTRCNGVNHPTLANQTLPTGETRNGVSFSEFTPATPQPILINADPPRHSFGRHNR